MASQENKSRSANYSKEEEDFIVSCMLPYKSIIENKRTNSVTNQAKDQAWVSIAEDFNANSMFGVRKSLLFYFFRFFIVVFWLLQKIRTAKKLKEKYRAILKGLRQKNANDKRNTMATGGGKRDASCDIPLSGPMSELADVVQLSVRGLTSQYDDDADSNDNAINTNNASDTFDLEQVDCEFLDDNEDDFSGFMPSQIFSTDIRTSTTTTATTCTSTNATTTVSSNTATDVSRPSSASDHISTELITPTTNSRTVDYRNLKSLLSTPMNDVVRSKKKKTEASSSNSSNSSEAVLKAKLHFFTREDKRADERHAAALKEHLLRVEELELQKEEKRLRIEEQKIRNKILQEKYDRGMHSSSSSKEGDNLSPEYC